jgi:LmbE family N-acetylglucosaminyl deacetylase
MADAAGEAGGYAAPRTLDPAAWSGRQVLVVAPHPDDEAFGAGGTAHLAARAGATVHVVVVARGDGGVDGRSDVAVREEESRRCCELLLTRPPLFLRVPSPELRRDPAAAGRALAAAVGATRFDVLLVPSPLERHDTHRACLLAALCADVGAPQAAWWGWGVWSEIPLGPGTVEVDISAARSAKTLAMSAHASQNRGRGLAAGMAARDMSQAALSRITGAEPRKAVERLLDLTALAGQRPAPASAAEARARAARFTAERQAAAAAELWA